MGLFPKLFKGYKSNYFTYLNEKYQLVETADEFIQLFSNNKKVGFKIPCSKINRNNMIAIYDACFKYQIEPEDITSTSVLICSSCYQIKIQGKWILRIDNTPISKCDNCGMEQYFVMIVLSKEMNMSSQDIPYNSPIEQSYTFLNSSIPTFSGKLLLENTINEGTAKLFEIPKGISIGMKPYLLILFKGSEVLWYWEYGDLREIIAEWDGKENQYPLHCLLIDNIKINALGN